jgi:hypothetical protein
MKQDLAPLLKQAMDCEQRELLLSKQKVQISKFNHKRDRSLAQVRFDRPKLLQNRIIHPLYPLIQLRDLSEIDPDQLQSSLQSKL